MRTRVWIVGVGAFLFGLALGALIFSDTQRRSLLAVAECEDCLNPNEATGLVASVLIQRFSGLIPSVVLETDKTIVIDHPFPQDQHHVVLIPKRDIKSVGKLSSGDERFLVDLFAAATTIVSERNLENYRIWSNGPKKQAVAYLHFHLAGS